MTTATRSFLQYSMLAAVAEMEAFRAKHLVYDRVSQPDAHTKALAEHCKAAMTDASRRCDVLQVKIDRIGVCAECLKVDCAVIHDS